MEEKLESVMKQNSPSVANQSTKSYATSVSDGLTKENLPTVLQASKNEDLVEAKEREKRSANLIVYGINETSQYMDPKHHDEQFIASFLNNIGLALLPKQIIRLGAPAENKKRPVKLVMKNIGDKDQVKSRLGNLREAEEIYRRLSVRDDYTTNERDLVRDYVKQAKERNDAENTDAWKVRGTPKNGLRLVKITKRR